jgi:hypothetical protein
MRQGGRDERQRQRPVETACQHRVGEPQRQNFGVRASRQNKARGLSRCERRAAIARGDLLHAGDRGAQRVVDFEVQCFGDVENDVVVERRRAIERALGDHHAAGRSRIVAAAAEKKSIAQHRLVLATTCEPHARGSGLQGEAPPPRPGKQRLGAHARIEHGEGGAGREGGFVGVGDRHFEARPARQGRQRKSFWDRIFCDSGHAGILPRNGALHHKKALQAPHLSCDQPVR